MIISALGLSLSLTYLVPSEDGGGWVGRSPSVPRQRGRLYTQGRIQTSSWGVGKSLLTPGTVTPLSVDFMLIWVNEGRLNTRTKPGYVLYRAWTKETSCVNDRNKNKQWAGVLSREIITDSDPRAGLYRTGISTARSTHGNSVRKTLAYKLSIKSWQGE